MIKKYQRNKSNVVKQKIEILELIQRSQKKYKTTVIQQTHKIIAERNEVIVKNIVEELVQKVEDQIQYTEKIFKKSEQALKNNISLSFVLVQSHTEEIVPMFFEDQQPFSQYRYTVNDKEESPLFVWQGGESFHVEENKGENTKSQKEIMNRLKKQYFTKIKVSTLQPIELKNENEDIQLLDKSMRNFKKHHQKRRTNHQIQNVTSQILKNTDEYILGNYCELIRLTKHSGRKKSGRKKQGDISIEVTKQEKRKQISEQPEKIKHTESKSVHISIKQNKQNILDQTNYDDRARNLQTCLKLEQYLNYSTRLSKKVNIQSVYQKNINKSYTKKKGSIIKLPRVTHSKIIN